MTAKEYLAALREALAVLPEGERANALRYYEEYFLDAGPENEARVIEELGPPEQAARQILGDYKEVAPAGPQADAGAEPLFGEGGTPPRGFRQEPFRPPHSSPLWNLLALVGALVLGVLIGIPLLVSAVAVVFSLIVTALAVLAGAAVAMLAILVVVPLGLLAAGGLLCIFSFFLWGLPASAVLTLGVGLCLLSAGCLLTVGCIKLCTSCFRPLLRAGGWCIDQCGRFLRWCGGAVRRFLDRIKGV